MRQHWHTDPEHITVAFGPSIRPCCYEVGAEFLGYFPREVNVRGGKYYLDLPRVVRRQLVSAGVPEGNIRDGAVCTCCDHQYFSYRREGAAAGRLISLIMIKSKGEDAHVHHRVCNSKERGRSQ
jgi:copper oxidase (laccase) domain-containing protein